MLAYLVSLRVNVPSAFWIQLVSPPMFASYVRVAHEVGAGTPPRAEIVRHPDREIR
jgi:hypothetical protein